MRYVLGFFEKFLDAFAPDVMITYGGDPTTQGMIRMARTRGMPVVFMIHDLRLRHYDKRSRTSIIASSPRSSPAGITTTGSASTARRCLTRSIGIASADVGSRARVCHVRQPVPGERGLSVRPHRPRAGPRRPDIPLLVVESRGPRKPWARAGSTSRPPATSRSWPTRPTPPVLVLTEDRPLALALVGKPAAGRHRGHDQWNPRHRLEPRRHPRDCRQTVAGAAALRSADAPYQDRARGRRSRALGRGGYPPLG